LKLSDIKGDRTLEVIAEVIEPISNIAENPEAAKLFKREKLPEGVTPKEFLLARAKKSVPVILKDHKEDVMSILAAIEGVTPKQYAENLNLVKLVRDFTELLADEAFAVLFISAQNGNTSGSAPESTAEQNL
jgi:hypothetical protein